MRDYWLSTKRMTISVSVDDKGVVTYAPPIAKMFIGQPLNNLRRWMRKQGGYKEETLKFSG
jgi:hypothetical protein